jgi:hypothetical protein
MLLEYQLLKPRTIIKEGSNTENEFFKNLRELGGYFGLRNPRGTFVVKLIEESKIIFEEVDLSKKCFRKIRNKNKDVLLAA